MYSKSFVDTYFVTYYCAKRKQNLLLTIWFQVRQYAAVLLRRRVVKQWTKLTPEVHAM